MKFKELSKQYLDHHAIRSKKSWRKDLSYINRLLLPTFGERSIKGIKRMDVVAWFNRVSVSSGPVAANRAQEVLRKIFNCAIDWELFEGRNPATRIVRNKERSRTEFVTPDVLPRLLIALTTCKSRRIRAAILFQLLSGLRPGEVLSLKWSYINQDLGILTLPETKNGKSHTLPLSSELLQLLQAVPRYHRREKDPNYQDDWVFQGRQRSQPLRSIHKQWYEIRNAAGMPTLRLHDLRRTVGSYLAMANFSERIIGQVLNHDSAKSTRVYTRLNLAPVQSALDHHQTTVSQISADAGLPSVHQLLTVGPLEQKLPLREAA